MRRDLSDKDGKIYLEICGLKCKINGYLELIESDEGETNNEIRSASGVSLSDYFMNQDNIIKVRIKKRGGSYMTNREHLQSLSDYEYSKVSVVHHMSTKPMYYMTSDSTKFEFTMDNMDEIWNIAQLYEIAWLEMEKDKDE